MCIATPPPARLRCHLLPTVSSRGPQIASCVKREKERCHLAGNYLARCSRAIRLPMAISGSATCKSCYLGSATCAARRSSRTTGDRSTVASWVAPCGHNADCCSSQPSMVQWLSSPIFPFCSFSRLSRYGDIRPNLHFYFP